MILSVCMDHVVLHYQPGSALRLSSLLQQTERLLEPFTCRPPPVFRPWFPSGSADRPLPIRPAKAAPRIGPAGDAEAQAAVPMGNQSQRGNPPPEDALCISETPNHLLPAGPSLAPAPGTHRRTEGDVSPCRRSWSVSTQRGVVPQRPQPLSKRFHRLVTVHRLHLHQRAKWVITEQNCRDVEQAWRSISRSVRCSALPACHAHIQRERAEIWVFCDVLHSERVGRFLKGALQLSGRIHLAVHRLGNIWSM